MGLNQGIEIFVMGPKQEIEFQLWGIWIDLGSICYF